MPFCRWIHPLNWPGFCINRKHKSLNRTSSWHRVPTKPFLVFPTGQPIGNHSFLKIKIKPNNFLAQGRQEIILLCLKSSEPPQSREAPVNGTCWTKASLWGKKYRLEIKNTEKLHSWNPVHSQSTAISWDHHGLKDWTWNSSNNSVINLQTAPIDAVFLIATGHITRWQRKLERNKENISLPHPSPFLTFQYPNSADRKDVMS